jgi:hypothetical protein
MTDEGSGPVITASEIGQHAFCARSWWLSRVKGYPSAHVREMASGRSAHRAHGRIVVRSHRLQRLAYALLFLAALVAALGIYLLTRGR